MCLTLCHNALPMLCVLTVCRLQPYFVGAQQADSTYKQTFAVEIIKKAAEEGYGGDRASYS